MIIWENKIRCKHCGDVIESKYRHDFVVCSCGTVAVDGGKDYLRRCFQTSPEADYEELSVYDRDDLGEDEPQYNETGLDADGYATACLDETTEATEI